MRILADNAIKEAEGQEKDSVILVGNIKDPETKERHDKLRAFGIGKKNFDLGFSGQLLVKCPKSKFKKLIATFPIVEGSGYWQTTHRWEGATIFGEIGREIHHMNKALNIANMDTSREDSREEWHPHAK